MRFLELKLNHFGKFNNQSISLKDGINLIYGENEAGKSTIHTFIRGMLFGIEKSRGRASKDDIYGKYQPWDTPGAYSGSMDLFVGDKTIRIYRSFDKNNKETSIIDLETGREIKDYYHQANSAKGYADKDNYNVLSELLEGLTESGFRNTISVEQRKARTGDELSDEVRNYITNLSLSRSNEVDVVKALGFLTTKRKELEALLPAENIKELQEAILEDLKKEVRMDELTAKLHELEIREKQFVEQLEKSKLIFYSKGFKTEEEYETYLNMLPVYEEKYNTYEGYQRQKVQHEDRLNLLIQEKKAVLLEDSKGMERNLQELEQNKLYIGKLETDKTTLLLKKGEDERSATSKQKVQFGAMFLGILILVFCVMGNKQLDAIGSVYGVFAGALVGGMVFAGGIIASIITHRNKGKENIYFQNALDELDNKLKVVIERNLEILLRFQVPNEADFRKKYEDLLKAELRKSHSDQLIGEQEENIKKLTYGMQVLKEEIELYIEPFHKMDLASNIGIKSLSREYLIQLREIVQSEKGLLKADQALKIREQEEFTLKKEKIKWELNLLEGYEDDLLKNQETLKELEGKEIEIRQELEAIQLATNTINSLAIDIHDTFGRKLNKIVSDLTIESTGGKYTDIKVDEKMNIKVHTKDRYVSLDKLSVGTMDQLYFAIRVGVANLIYGENVMPLLFDDSFALYDDERTQSILKYLSKKKHQVLIFTCHKREKEILDRNQLSYNYIDLGNN
ncbi:MAG: ATP-binding protein [Anaerocolumna sp.]